MRRPAAAMEHRRALALDADADAGTGEIGGRAPDE